MPNRKFISLYAAALATAVALLTVTAGLAEAADVKETHMITNGSNDEVAYSVKIGEDEEFTTVPAGETLTIDQGHITRYDLRWYPIGTGIEPTNECTHYIDNIKGSTHIRTRQWIDGTGHLTCEASAAS
jgi:hypothetical protein